MKHVISINDFTREELDCVLHTAQKIKEKYKTSEGRSELKKHLQGKKVATLFFQASTRTRVSSETAAREMGAFSDGITSVEGTAVKKGEPFRDTLRMYEGFLYDAFVIRDSRMGAARFASEVVNVPIINGGDGSNQHPTQTMIDLFTILETQGSIDGKTIAIVGDLKYGRTTHSLLTALSLYKDVKVHLVSPKALEMPEYYLKLFKRRTGRDCVLHRYLEEVIPLCDVIYMTRIQEEYFVDRTEYEKLKSSYRLTKKMIEQIGPKGNLKILHPLPRNKRYCEILFDVDDTVYAGYINQAWNGPIVRSALLGLVFGVFDWPQVQKTGTINNVPKFAELPVSEEKKESAFKVYEIENGTVIDHVPTELSVRVMYLLGLVKRDLKMRSRAGDNFMVMGTNLSTGKLGENKKAVIKLENKYLSEDDFTKLALEAPNVTVNMIKNKKVTRKFKLVVPTEVIGHITCPNVNCITRPETHEGVTSKFIVVQRGDNYKPVALRCHYCERHYCLEELKLSDSLND